MTQFRLKFPRQVEGLEKSHQWMEAVELVFREWRKEPFDLNALLCAGTEAYCILVMCHEMEPEHRHCATDPSTDRKPLDEGAVTDMLMDVTRFGLRHFSDNAVFNGYFGFMMDLFPLIFDDKAGDCVKSNNFAGWEKKGREMLRHGLELEPEHPFLRAVCAVGKAAREELWARMPPEKWGSSMVSRWFFYELEGDRFYKNPYGETVDW